MSLAQSLPQHLVPSHAGRATTVIVLEVLLAAGAWVGGGLLFFWPDGSALGLPGSLLTHSGFDTFRAPGLLLVLVNGVVPLVSAWATFRKRTWAAASVVLSGVLLMGWIVVQVALLRSFSVPLHGAYLLLGVALTALGVMQRLDDLAARVPKRLETHEATNRVVMLEKFGGPESFTVMEQPMPKPAPGEVLVKVLAASVQFTDVILRQGRYPDLKQKPPLVLGYDLVGEVVALGPGVVSPRVGQRVADLTMTGSYAQYRTLEASRVVPVDRALDVAQATTLVLSWVIAFQLLHRDALVRSGQRVLIIGAAGAVGQALVALARLADCQVWGAGRAHHAELIRTSGATFVDSDTTDFAKVVAGGFDVVFDGIGEAGFSRAWRAVGPYGRLSAFGFSEGVKSHASLARLGFWFAKLWWWNVFSKGRSARFVSITTLRKQHPDWFVADLTVLLGLLGSGKIHPRVAERLRLDEVADAHRHLEAGQLEGKLVLMPHGALT